MFALLLWCIGAFCVSCEITIFYWRELEGVFTFFKKYSIIIDGVGSVCQLRVSALSVSILVILSAAPKYSF